MNERDSTLLDNYFNGLLSPEEANDVRALTLTDTDFGAEFSLREAMEAFPRKETERVNFQDLLRSIGKDYFRDELAETPQIKVVRNNIRRWIALAASVALIATAIWFFNQPKAQPSLYNQFAQHAPLSLTVMGKTETIKTDAEIAFAQKNHTACLAALEQVLVAEPDNIRAIFYKGICLVELGRTPEARAIFEPLSAGSSAFQEDAAWYVALSYLADNNLPAVRAILSQIAPGDAHYEDAQALLKEIG
ncbi:MAG: tetratricopeptide repeat protein [Saprospiraceae bacterium]